MKIHKTEMCRYIEANLRCPHKKCHFAHGPKELQHRLRHVNHKTALCENFFTFEGCIYGSRCDFIHPEVDYKPVVKTVGFQLETNNHKILRFNDLIDAGFLFE